MATRAIKLKIVQPRTKEGTKAAQALWHTHCQINQATRHYEDALLLMRQRRYLVAEDCWVTEQQVDDRLTEAIHAAVSQNNRPALSGDQLIEAKQHLRLLYEAIIPSAIQKSGSAKNANEYLSLLIDPNSDGQQKIFNKLRNLPEWLEGVENGEVEAFERAYAWLNTEEGQRRMKPTGSPPTWVRKARKTPPDPEWPAAFAKDINAKLKEAAGVPTTVRQLKRLGVLPLFKAYIAPKLQSRGAACSWDRLTFRLAAAHLMSWESWCHIAETEHQARQSKLDNFSKRYLTGDDAERALAKLRGYERQRTAELAAMSLGIEGDFLINRRMLRGWDHLREKLQKLRSPTLHDVQSAINESLTKQRHKCGDPHLLAWLAQEENHCLWNGATDWPSMVATCNDIRKLVDRSREQALMTLPHAVDHPRAAQWEAEGGSNLKCYRLHGDDAGLWVELPLLTGSASNLSEATFSFTLSANAQFNLQSKDKRQVYWKVNNQDLLKGELGAADLLFDRSHQTHRSVSQLEREGPGPAWLKLSIDCQPLLIEGGQTKRPKALTYFQRALPQQNAKPATDAAEVQAGLRVMSVDLGIRSFASCVVHCLYERDRAPQGAFAIRLEDGRTLWAAQERAFQLRLPGEKTDKQGRRLRGAAWQALSTWRRTLARYRKLYRLVMEQNPEARLQALSAIAEEAHWPAEHAAVAQLEKQVAADETLWTIQVEQQVRALRRELSPHFSEWRKSTRARRTSDSSAKPSFGKSLEGIDYLTSARRLVMSWSLLGARSGEIKRLNREQSGSFAAGLQDHINNLKDDRSKTGADLLIQAARGFVYADGGWQQRFAPCQFVVLEDLSRYRMKTDRARRENVQLMQWSHRSVLELVQMQAELYGIHIADTAAAFSSRYSGKTFTPGIRCKQISKADLDSPYIVSRILEDNPGLSAGQLSVGAWVYSAGGDHFAYLLKGKLQRVQADINAASQLGYRFLSRHQEPFRLVCVRVIEDGEEYWVPRTLGKRLLGALGGHGRLADDGAGHYLWQELTSRQWKRLAGTQHSAEEGDEVQALADDHLERTGELKVFFRDPSGQLFNPQHWLASEVFWGVVKSRSTKMLISCSEVSEPEGAYF